MRRFVVGVMGAGEGASARDMELARALGRQIAAEGWVLLTGGRDAGVMRAANAGAKEIEGSLTVGLLPDRDARPSPDVDLVLVTGLGQARNNVNVLSSDVVIACGSGGAGTVSEIALALKAGKPTVLLAANPAAVDFFRSLNAGKIAAVDTPEEAVANVREIYGRDKDSESRAR